MAFEPSVRLQRALGETRNEGAAAWLRDAAGALDAALEQSGAALERVVVPGGRSSVVALVRTADGEPAALKVAPEAARPADEAAALGAWSGLGAAKLLASGPGWMLLERLQTDVSVRTLPEAKALLEAAGTLRRLWVPVSSYAFETVEARTARQAAAMSASADGETAGLVEAAVAARESLLAAPPEHVLLHGSLRQSKILAAGRMPWLAVGPVPVVGERAFDLARLVRDRVEDLVGAPSGAAVTRSRLRRLADSLDVDRDRLRGWVLFRAVESGVRARRVGREEDAELLLEFATWL
ncbi:aminoglycoside phosphotransferase family protein [Streptomyces sp. NPDC060194]|uniref:aminoglycoside phosphotransferase family protein n=1 Tax=Streptomyces sp. NPDC060194 TaxID=3347069 RepID=UPI003646083D